MVNVCIAFKKVDGVSPYYMRKGKIRPAYDHVDVHMVFDINIDGKFTRKSILVSDGHITALPQSITYSSVVYIKRIRIAFLISPLTNVEIFACDIVNVYLNVNFCDNIWTGSGT